MANHVEIIQFKTQQQINADRQKKLAQKKADIRRRVEEIKNSHTQRSERAKA